MHPMPLVSVIIPTYNRANIILKTINSVLSQTYKNFEIIIVDDGSSDHTDEVIANLKDNRIRYIQHENNSNGSVARNTGIEAANGEYIAFLDSDDLWLPEKLEKQLSIIKSFPQKERIICYCQLIADNGITKRVLPKRGLEKDESVEDYLFVHDGVMQTSTLFMHKSILKEILFNPNLIRHQDWDLCIRLNHKKYNFIFIEEPLVIWSDDNKANRVSRQKNWKFSIEWINTYKGIISRDAYYFFIEKYVKPYVLEIDYKELTNKKKLVHLIELTKDKKVVLYGAGLSTQYLLNQLSKEQKKWILGLIDSSPEKQGKVIEGIKVYNPKQLEHLNVDRIIISVEHIDVSIEILNSLKDSNRQVVNLNECLIPYNYPH